MGFEMDETEGLILYDTGTVPNGRSFPINGTTQALADLGGGQRGITCGLNQGGMLITPNDLLFDGPLTIETQFYMDSNSGSHTVLCGLRTNTIETFYLVYSNHADYKLFTKTKSGTARRTVATPPRDQWVHLVCSFSDPLASVSHVRLNGVIQSLEAGIGWASGEQKTMIGNYQPSPGSSYSFKGQMNFLRVYEAQMSEADTLRLYNAAPAL
jgi:hypothetical protein